MNTYKDLSPHAFLRHSFSAVVKGLLNSLGPRLLWHSVRPATASFREARKLEHDRPLPYCRGLNNYPYMVPDS